MKDHLPAGRLAELLQDDALGIEHVHRRNRNPLGRSRDRGEIVIGDVEDAARRRAGNDQGVPGRARHDVEEGEAAIVPEDFEAGDLAAQDLCEDVLIVIGRHGSLRACEPRSNALLFVDASKPADLSTLPGRMVPLTTGFDPGHSIESARRTLTARLQAAGIEEPGLDARLLVGAAVQLDLTGMATQATRRLTPEETACLEQYAQRRLAHEPVARILGAREFWGMPFRLSEATLVPRPDTETVVELALEIFRGLPVSGRPPRIADIGTGSGAILLALLHEIPDAFGVGTDLSLTALGTARDNAAALGLAGRAAFVACSYASALRGPFDLIVSNPLHSFGRNSDIEPRGARARSASGTRRRQ